jgi:hypothetical protein
VALPAILAAAARVLGAGGRAGAARAVSGTATPGGSIMARGMAQGGKLPVAKPVGQAGGGGHGTLQGLGESYRNGQLLNSLFTAEQIVGVGKGGLAWIDSWFPGFHYSVFVGVKGGPDATLKRIWQLALAIAFGRLRNAVTSFNGVSVDATWDITGKAVGVRISYSGNGLVAHVLGKLNPDGRQSGYQFLQSGPLEETVGGNWPDFLLTSAQLAAAPKQGVQLIGGGLIPQNIAVLNPDLGGPQGNFGRLDNNIEREGVDVFPVLPDDGRLITTRAKLDANAQNPKPPVSNAMLVALVSNALAEPCYLPPGPPAGHQLSNPIPRRVYSPGTDLKSSDILIRLDGLVKAMLNIVVPNTDGYPTRKARETAGPVPLPTNVLGSTNAGDH